MLGGGVTATREETVARNGMVAAGHRLEAETGVAVLRQGGNAVDAAVAAAFVAEMAEPAMCGIGAHGVMSVHWAATGEKQVIDFYDVAPSAASPQMYEIIPGGDVVSGAARLPQGAERRPVGRPPVRHGPQPVGGPVRRARAVRLGAASRADRARHRPGRGGCSGRPPHDGLHPLGGEVDSQVSGDGRLPAEGRPAPAGPGPRRAGRHASRGGTWRARCARSPTTGPTSSIAATWPRRWRET